MSTHANDTTLNGVVVRRSTESALGYVRAVGGERDGWEYPFRWDAVTGQLPLKPRQTVRFAVNDSEALDQLWADDAPHAMHLHGPELYPFGVGGKDQTQAAVEQKVLDPAQRERATDSGAPTLPQELRHKLASFSHLPNVDDWQPGDLMLFADQMSNKSRLWRHLWATTKIRWQQWTVPPLPHARWTHAAMYVGHYHLCEALPGKGVIYRSILSYFDHGDFLLRVRRYQGGLNPEQQHTVCVKAMSAMRHDYSYLGVIKALRRVSDRPEDSLEPEPVAVTYSRQFHSAHCAELYCGAYLGIGLPLHQGHAVSGMIPARLSSNPALEDIDLRWIRCK